MASIHRIGISGFAVYVPPFEVNLQEWCCWSDNDWSKIQQVVGDKFRMRGTWENAYTMAATAVLRLIDQYSLNASDIGFLALGTESSTDNSAGAIIVKGMVNDVLSDRGLHTLPRACEVPEYKQACLGGIYALKGALRYMATDARHKYAVVVCSDFAEYERGTTGEATQGAGAVAILVERNPKMLEIDLSLVGSTSDYRVFDFRKPFSRSSSSLMQCEVENRPLGAHFRGFPVFNGKYSRSCYLNAVLSASDHLFSHLSEEPIEFLRSFHAIFLHRPFSRMVEMAWFIIYLMALLTSKSPEDRQELQMYVDEASIDLEQLASEVLERIDVSDLIRANLLSDDLYPLSRNLLSKLRSKPAIFKQITDKLGAGLEAMNSLGNLYTASLPAWIATNLWVASNKEEELVGKKILSVGYGSGDAAEIIPMTVAKDWRSNARKIKFDEAVREVHLLSQEEYESLHDRTQSSCLPFSQFSNRRFIIERVGVGKNDRVYDDGIEYYSYE